MIFSSKLGTPLGHLVLDFGVPIPATDTVASNTEIYTQTVTYNYITGQLVFSNYTPVHTVSFNRSVVVSASNTLTQTGNAVGIKIHPASSVYSPGQSATYVFGKTVKNQLDLSQIVQSNQVYSQNVSSYFQYFQTTSKNVLLHPAASNAYTPVGVATAIKGQIVLAPIVWMQTAVLQKSTPASSVLIQTQTVVVAVVRTINLTSTLRQQSSGDANTAKKHGSFNGFGLNQFVKVWKVYYPSPSNTYVPVNVAISGTLTNENIGNTLTQTGTVGVQKVMTCLSSSILTQHQDVLAPSTRSLATSNTLTYLNNHQVYVPVGNLGNILVDNLIVRNIKTKTVTGKTVFPYCTLQVPQRAITLPAPEFNDSAGYAGMFTIRRSMNGATVTYVHRLNTEKLKYTFIFGIPKMLELENYLLNFNSQIHTLTNWKGEIWYVFITNNPMELIAKARYSNGLGNTFDDREKITITLEFEGTRIA